MLTDFFVQLQLIIAGLLEALVETTSGIVPIFYDTTASTFTIYGIFLIFGLAMFFLMFAWRVIQGFIRR